METTLSQPQDIQIQILNEVFGDNNNQMYQTVAQILSNFPDLAERFLSTQIDLREFHSRMLGHPAEKKFRTLGYHKEKGYVSLKELGEYSADEIFLTVNITKATKEAFQDPNKIDS